VCVFERAAALGVCGVARYAGPGAYPLRARSLCRPRCIPAARALAAA
jgi:hypothetical protein